GTDSVPAVPKAGPDSVPDSDPYSGPELFPRRVTWRAAEPVARQISHLWVEALYAHPAASELARRCGKTTAHRDGETLAVLGQLRPPDCPRLSGHACGRWPFRVYSGRAVECRGLRRRPRSQLVRRQ